MSGPMKINPHGSIPSQPTPLPKQTNAAGSDFAQALDHAQELKFSNHAQKRLENRKITLSDDGLARLTDAVEKAEKRGGKESLVLMDELAFIVNVKERLVVTAMEANSGGEGVFTQIDTVVLAKQATAKPEESSLSKSA